MVVLGSRIGATFLGVPILRSTVFGDPGYPPLFRETTI